MRMHRVVVTERIGNSKGIFGAQGLDQGMEQRQGAPTEYLLCFSHHHRYLTHVLNVL